jgi:hypothetical protein
MAPVDLARHVYKSEPCVRTFEQDLNWHLEHGFVFSRPDFFVMGRPVVHTAPAIYIVGQHRFPSAVCDCWHVYLMAGNVGRAWSMLPWDLPWVSFERENVLRFHPLASIRRLSGGFPALQPETSLP